MIVATGRATSNMSYEEQEQQRNRWLQQFATTFGTDEGDESTSFNGTIPQVLMMFNGDMIREATSGGPGTIVDQAMTDPALKGNKAVDFLFKAGFARDASRDEQKIAQALLSARKGDPREALRDIWWIVLNSNEFILIH
jgi:hypothetical protein